MSMYEKRKALLIGIDEYDHYKKLKGCKNDVVRMTEVLQKHENGNPNFTVLPEINICNDDIRNKVEELLARDATTVLLYFAGHGQITQNGGFICGKDTSKFDPGVSMDWLSDQINQSEIPEVVVILDCCYAGSFSSKKTKKGVFTRLRKGVTILAATSENDTAGEFARKGTFTSILYDGLKGAAMDVLGHVTTTSLYTNAEFILSAWEQRPIFKSFVKQLTPLRFCLPREKKDILRKILVAPFFPLPKSIIQLNERMLIGETIGEFGPDEIYALAAFEKAGLITCSDNLPLMIAMKQNGTCKLSPYGIHIRELFIKIQA